MEGEELCTVGAVEDASAVMVTCAQGYMLQVLCYPSCQYMMPASLLEA